MNTQEKHTHTPGPWNYIGHDKEGSGYHMVEIGENDPNNTTALALVTSPGGALPGEAEANAHLIAAAPELLAALKAMLRVALKCDDKAWAMAIERSDETRPCDMAMEALAKARGEQH